MARKWEELQILSDEDLITEHDEKAKHAEPGINYYLEELRSRHLNRQSEAMLKYTRQVTKMTIIIAVATIINIVVLINSLCQQ